MNLSQFFSEKFGKSSIGLMRMLQSIPQIDKLPDSSLGIFGKLLVPVFKAGKNDYFDIAVNEQQIKLISGSAAGFFSAIEALKKQADSGDISSEKIELLFQHRLYKIETSFALPETGSHKTPENRINITEMPDDFWHSLYQNLVTRGFNVLVLYAGSYHPFEHFLDYKGFPHAVEAKHKGIREKNFKALENMLQIAKEYGLETFMQHYVSHFTQVLSDYLKMGLKEGGSRLANFDNPEIDAYTTYVYQKTFETLPDLDGLFFNFESCGNSKEFLERTLIKAVKKLKRKPILYFRLWGISEVDAIKGVIDLYDGPVRLMHKSHDTNDVYYYPAADDRVRLWKKALPNMEFTFSMGPCHNCATNLSSKIWTDPEYIHQLMNDMLYKGADSVSFQASYDTLVYFLKGNEKLTDWQKNHSKNNFGHIEAFCDFVFQRKVDDKTWATRYANIYNVKEEAGKQIYKAVVNASRVMLKHKWQYCVGSFSEGYLFPGRFSLYQDPFFYYPMSSVNTLGEIKYNLGMHAWLKRDKTVKTVPNDTQYVIDYVNPAVKKKTKNNPAELAKQIREHNKNIYASIASYQKLAGKKVDKVLVEKILLNANWGERAWREIEISISLCKSYFAKTKKEFFGHLKDARNLMLDACKKVDIPKSQQFLNINGSGPFIPDQDAEDIQKILVCEKDNYPFEALKHHLNSHLHYNEIRRLMRPYSSMRNEKIPYAANLLRKAISETEKSLEFLSEQKYALYRHNVNQWLHYMQVELQSLLPPSMICYRNDAIKENENFQRLTHDQCFLYGERCWDDFYAFFYPKNYFRQDNMECRATWSEKGLIISLKENGIKWSEREEVWNKNKGTVNQTGFLQIFVEDGVTCKSMQHLTLFFKGEGGTQIFSEEGPNCKHSGTKSVILSDYEANFTNTDSWWRVDVTLPWKRFKKKPRKGDVWRMNLLSNPEVKRNHRGIWCQGFEIFNDITRLGYIHFQ